jgi:hypothetical protein
VTNIRRRSASDPIAPNASPACIVFARESARLNVLFVCSRDPLLPRDAEAQPPGVQP